MNIEYRIETENDADYLASTIRQAARGGWKLQGGVSITLDASGVHYLYAQAMWRERE